MLPVFSYVVPSLSAPSSFLYGTVIWNNITVNTIDIIYASEQIQVEEGSSLIMCGLLN